jgi:hypothetical protein
MEPHGGSSNSAVPIKLVQIILECCTTSMEPHSGASTSIRHIKLVEFFSYSMQAHGGASNFAILDELVECSLYLAMVHAVDGFGNQSSDHPSRK